jgi:hypothetical protein
MVVVAVSVVAWVGVCGDGDSMDIPGSKSQNFLRR